MKRRIQLGILALSAGCILSGCSAKKDTQEINLETYDSSENSAASAVTSSSGSVIFEGSEAEEPETEYDFGYRASDYVTAEDFSDITPDDVQTEEVTNSMVSSEITRQMEAADLWESKLSGIVNKWDIANVSYSGTVQDDEFPDNSGTGVNLTAGGNEYFSEFGELLIGKEIGKEYTQSVTLPDTFGEYAGKEAVYTIKINSVKYPPVLTDEIAAKLSGQKYQNVNDYRQYVRTCLEAQKQETADDLKFESVLAKIAKTAVIQSIPDIEMENVKTMETLLKEAKEKGMELSIYMQENNISANRISDDEIKLNMLIQYIAEKAGIGGVTDSDLDKIYDSMSEDGTKEEIDSQYTERELARMALKEKVENYILQGK